MDVHTKYPHSSSNSVITKPKITRKAFPQKYQWNSKLRTIEVNPEWKQLFKEKPQKRARATRNCRITNEVLSSLGLNIEMQ